MHRNERVATVKPFHAAAVEDDVREIVALVNASFSDAPDKVLQVQRKFGAGLQKAQVDAWPDDEVGLVYAEAYRLFGEARYDEALPLALYLSVNRPLDQRFMFMAGMILQLLGDSLLAATFYSMLLALDPNFMPAAFRMAECYVTLGEHEDAREIFEMGIDIGRETLGDADDFYELQRLIYEQLRALN